MFPLEGLGNKIHLWYSPDSKIQAIRKALESSKSFLELMDKLSKLPMNADLTQKDSLRDLFLTTVQNEIVIPHLRQMEVSATVESQASSDGEAEDNLGDNKAEAYPSPHSHT